MIQLIVKVALDRREGRKLVMGYVYGGQIDEDDFSKMVKFATRGIKRLNNIEIDEACVFGTVLSNSGLSEWKFKIDFNDRGEITGDYALYCENEDSSIPIFIADKIKKMIQNYPHYEGYKYWNINDRNLEIEKEKTKRNEIYLKHKAEEEKRDNRFFFIVVGCFVLIYIIMSGVWRLDDKIDTNKHKANGDIEVGKNYDKLVGKNYKDVETYFKKLGFKDIVLKKHDDLIIGIINKDGEVEKISINGDTEFDSDWYPKKSKIEITYHTH